MKYDNLAESIIENVGGEENIKSVIHCITRLRFKLKDENKAKTLELNEIEGVLTVVQSSGQYQVVIGSHVSDVHKAILKVGKINNEVAVEEEKEGTHFRRFVDLIFGIFHPILGVLLASGLFQGITALLVAGGLIDSSSGFYFLMNTVGEALFQFLPMFIAYTAMKNFGGTPLIGLGIGIILSYPRLVGMTFGEPLYLMFEGSFMETPVYLTLMGMPILILNYGSALLPMILAAYLGAEVEKKLQKILPSDVKTIAVPFLTLLAVVPVTFLFLGPAAMWIGTTLGMLVLEVYRLSPVLVGVIFGGIWQYIVIHGLHWLLIPIAIHNVMTFGYDVALVAMLGASFAQMGAVMAVRMKTKNEKIKKISLEAIVSGFFGVLEPSIYGVTLPLKKPFHMSCIASAVAGGVMGYFGTKIYLIGGLGIFGIPNYLNPEAGFDRAFMGAISAAILAMILSFVLTYMVGFEEEALKEERITFEVKKTAKAKIKENAKAKENASIN